MILSPEDNESTVNISLCLLKIFNLSDILIVILVSFL